MMGPRGIEVAPEVEGIEDEEVEALPDLSITAMVMRDVSHAAAPGILDVIVVARKSRVSTALSVVGEDTSVLCALIGMRPAITLAAVVVAVVATEIAGVEEGEEVAPLHKKPVNSRETSKDSPACARWGVLTADHSETEDDDPRNDYGQ